MKTELPTADIADACVHSAGWVAEQLLTYAIWWLLPSGALALSTSTLGAPLMQDTRAHVVREPDA